MDKSLEETRKLNEKSRQSKNSYTNMSESALQQARQANANSASNQSSYSQDSYRLQQARQENMKSANSATNSVLPSSNSGMSNDPTLEEVKKENEKSRQNKGK
jgi:hypothetical protein